MKTRSSLLILLLLLLAVICHGQTLTDKTLMTVAGKSVPAGEFIRMYKKSSEPGNLTDIDQYLQQYVIFKLKVADAVAEGLDTTRIFRNELNGYRNQLAQSYLTDNQTREKILKRTYQRSLTEIKAWHILISCPDGSKPEDTLTAWQKANDIRERIIAGEPFEQVARSSSDDPSVKFNGGNLGYFSVFQMIMPFEDAAYNLKKGQLSKPVRTPYGFHIIKLEDKRASRGKILVAHIMKSAPPGTDETTARKAEEAIKSIYKELQSGISFRTLAAKYSDHKESAANGGLLNWFGTGEMIPDFSEAAFSISDTGNYSPPVRTLSGWHIIKLLDRKTPGTYDETKSYLESRLNQSYLNSLSKKTFVDNLKKQYNFRINQSAYRWFVENTDTLIIKGLSGYKRNGIPKGNIYTFADQRFTSQQFANYIEKRGFMIVTDDPSSFISKSLGAEVSDHIIKYENSQLEKKYPDFRFLINEFHDGILLFEISGKNVWNKVQEDSLGLRRYYEEHKQNFLTRESMSGKLYNLHSPDGEKILEKAFRKYSRKSGTDGLLLRKFNRKNDSLLTITGGTWSRGDDPSIDKLKWITGHQSFKYNNFPAVISVSKIDKPVPLPFDEVRNEMITGYQEYLEAEWIKQLKTKYPVNINNLVLNEIKMSLKNE